MQRVSFTASKENYTNRLFKVCFVLLLWKQLDNYTSFTIKLKFNFGSAPQWCTLLNLKSLDIHKGSNFDFVS